MLLIYEYIQGAVMSACFGVGEKLDFSGMTKRIAYCHFCAQYLHFCDRQNKNKNSFRKLMISRIKFKSQKYTISKLKNSRILPWLPWQPFWLPWQPSVMKNADLPYLSIYHIGMLYVSPNIHIESTNECFNPDLLIWLLGASGSTMSFQCTNEVAGE